MSDESAISGAGGDDRRGRLRLVVGLGIVVTAFYLLIGSMTDKEMGTYFLEVDEAIAQGPQLTDRKIRVKGNVVVGSYVTDNNKQHAFRIEGKGKVLSVRYEGPMPDVFREGIEVVAEGRLNAQKGEVEATEIIAKCPSKYEEGQIPEAMKKKLSERSP